MDDGPPLPHVARIRRNARARRWIVETDDGLELSLAARVIEEAGIVEGSALPAEVLEKANADTEEAEAHEAALRLLEYRARSEREMARRLSMRGFTDAAIERVVERLRRVGLLDDDAFARSWVADRERTSPKGRMMLRYQLIGQGIAPNAADTALAEVDDEAMATELARRRARTAPTDTYERFAAKVGPYLQRRGFPYAVADAATRAAWADTHSTDDPNADVPPLE